MEVSNKPIQRSKRPYESLGSTQRRQRRSELRAEVQAAAQRIGCPIEALRLQPPTPPEELLHLSTSERERIRTVPSLHIPCEQTIIKCKELLATTHATETGTFANGAYITDPVRFVSALCAQSPLLVVGGDAGDGLTKLGVTYLEADKTQKFAALLVYRGKDTYDDLEDLQQPGLAPFKGDSSSYPHIFAVLQHFIDSNVHKAFLNGDWPFINTLLGSQECICYPSMPHLQDLLPQPPRQCSISQAKGQALSQSRSLSPPHHQPRAHRSYSSPSLPRHQQSHHSRGVQ